MDFDLQVAHSLEEIDAQVWDSLGGGKPFTSYRWYRFGEAALKDCPPIYVILRHGGQAVARAAFWLKRQEWLQVTSPLARYGMEWMLKRWPLLVCETPLAGVPALILPEEAPLRAAALETLARLALKLGVENGASFSLFGYLDEPETRQAGWPEEYSAVSFSDAETCLPISWRDFEEYLRSRAQSTRRNFRLHGEQAKAMGVQVAIQPQVEDLERAVTLIRDVERYHRVGHRFWTRSMLENAGRVDSAWIAARIDDRLVGCCLLVGDGDAQIATLLGLDYSVPQFIYIYYQIMYAVIRCAIEKRTRILYGGGGAYEFKRRLGFQMLPDNYLVIAASGKPFRWLFRGLHRWLGMQSPGAVVSGNPPTDHQQ